MSSGTNSGTATTSTVSASGNPTSNVQAPTPTFTAASRAPRVFASIFDAATVPDGQAIFSDLDAVDPKDDTKKINSEYVVQYVGTYLVKADGAAAKTPFDPSIEVTLATVKSQAIVDFASGSASGCAATCDSLGARFSVNSVGVCYCGSKLKLASLTAETRSKVDTPCKDDTKEYCGGGVTLSETGDSYVAIVAAVRSDSDVVVVTPAGQTLLPSKFLLPPLSITLSHT